MRLGNRRFGCMKAMQIYVSVIKYLVKPINGEARHYTKSRPATPSLGSLIKDVPSSTDILRSCKQHSVSLKFSSSIVRRIQSFFFPVSFQSFCLYISPSLIFSLYFQHLGQFFWSCFFCCFIVRPTIFSSTFHYIFRSVILVAA